MKLLNRPEPISKLEWKEEMKEKALKMRQLIPLFKLHFYYCFGLPSSVLHFMNLTIVLC